MRHLLLTGVMLVSALFAVWGVADLLEGSQRSHTAAQVELRQRTGVATPQHATPAAAVSKVAIGGN